MWHSIKNDFDFVIENFSNLSGGNAKVIEDFLVFVGVLASSGNTKIVQLNWDQTFALSRLRTVEHRYSKEIMLKKINNFVDRQKIGYTIF